MSHASRPESYRNAAERGRGNAEGRGRSEATDWRTAARGRRASTSPADHSDNDASIDDLTADDDRATGGGVYVPPFREREADPWRAGGGNRQRLHSKISFGVILTRINPETRRPEAVLVRGRYSYEYAEFVHGRYSRKNVRAVSALFDAMSVNERLDIYSLDFGQMWYRIWLTAERRELYNKKLAKFHTAWMRDDSGEYLRQLVQASRTDPIGRLQHGGGIRWEFPKGKRLSNREPDLNCAIREFEEEAGIAKRDYQILPGFKRRVSFVHMGVRYVNVYYVAIARRELEPGVDLRALDQVAEISEVRWMDIEQIRLIDTPSHRLETTVAPVFKYVKRYVRGLVPSRSLAFRMTPDGDSIDVAAHFERLRDGRGGRPAEAPAPLPGLPPPAPRPSVARRGRNLECKDDVSVGVLPPAEAPQPQKDTRAGRSTPSGTEPRRGSNGGGGSKARPRKGRGGKKGGQKKNGRR